MSGIERPACDLVRRALGSVVASETFARSERLRSFLSYIVENELSGKAAQLKGYSIGIDVFGRPPGFDAGADPLVRVQAGKLRKLLDQYYEGEGIADRLRIRVPLGSYVPEYSLAGGMTDEAIPDLPAVRPARQKPHPRRSWLPAPVSSPLALFSLLPLFFLAPSLYPGPLDAAIDRAQLALITQARSAADAEALPRLHILQCWPAGGDCNALADEIARSAGYHRTVHLAEAPQAGEPPQLAYAIRVENQPDGGGIYASLVHEQSGATIYARHFSPAQLQSKSGIAFEAVTFTTRALSANGPLYRHALRNGTASNAMECLARRENGLPHPGQTAACPSRKPAALAEAAVVSSASLMQ